jgi:hypothetical protein
MGKAGAGSGTRRGILMFLVLLICLAAIVLIGTELFQVENISVTGSAALDEGVIISTSGKEEPGIRERKAHRPFQPPPRCSLSYGSWQSPSPLQFVQ